MNAVLDQQSQASTQAAWADGAARTIAPDARVSILDRIVEATRAPAPSPARQSLRRFGRGRWRGLLTESAAPRRPPTRRPSKPAIACPGLHSCWLRNTSLFSQLWDAGDQPHGRGQFL